VAGNWRPVSPLLAVAAAILATALAATWGPVVRALDVDPNTALREE